jgi:hypothetical protein
MLTLGVLLLILSLLFDVALLWQIGLILTVVGLILAVLGTLGRAVGPRSHYY